MPQVKANGITLEYEDRGGEGGEPMLLIMGLGAQLTRWPRAFTNKIVDRGYWVIAFDNRDVGLSEKLESAGPPDIGAIVGALSRGEKPPAAYTLDDMAADAVGLLDALNIRRAHIVGASMGGMIAQLVAADYPDRVLSLTSIMSSTGNPDLPRATPEAMAVINNRGPDPTVDLEGFLDHAVTGSRTIGSPGYPVPEATLREQTLQNFKRSYYPAGFQRQYAAVIASPDRRPKIKSITVPTMVVHGEADPLVPLAAGRDTAQTIPGAQLRVIPGMGHDIPAALYDEIVDAIVSAAQRAKATA